MIRLALFLIIASAVPAIAAPPRNCFVQTVVPKPTKSDEDLAATLQEQGNDLFVRKSYAEALERYRGALAAWNHAKLHLAVGLAYLKLSRWVEAAEHFEYALARPDQLEGDLDKAKNNYAVAVANTGVAAIRNTQGGVTVTLDGRVVELVKGTAECRVAPGPHVVVARRGSLESDTRSFEVPPNSRIEVAPVVFTVETHWRWKRWKPWALVAAGGAIALVGVPLALSANNRTEDFDRQAADFCSARGCPPDVIPDRIDAIKRSADQRRQAAIISIAGGGAILAAGLVLVGLNRPETRKVIAPDSVTIVPWHDGRGVSARVDF